MIVHTYGKGSTSQPHRKVSIKIEEHINISSLLRICRYVGIRRIIIKFNPTKILHRKKNYQRSRQSRIILIENWEHTLPEYSKKSLNYFWLLRFLHQHHPSKKQAEQFCYRNDTCVSFHSVSSVSISIKKNFSVVRKANTI